jgi:hypothetical protein
MPRNSQRVVGEQVAVQVGDGEVGLEDGCLESQFLTSSIDPGARFSASGTR